MPLITDSRSLADGVGVYKRWARARDSDRVVIRVRVGTASGFLLGYEFMVKSFYEFMVFISYNEFIVLDYKFIPQSIHGMKKNEFIVL